jgi:glutamate carboxypeptidase
VEVESPSRELDAIVRCAETVAEVGQKILGVAPDVVVEEGRPNLRWRFGGEPRVQMLGHFDTVWPLGTIDRWPFALEDGRATGPGIFDMKAGLVQGLFAVAALPNTEGIEILFNSDEEVGSHSSKALIEEGARHAKAVLVLEPSENGALKIARKGVAAYVVEVKGRAAHAGLEPEKGANAMIELAHLVLATAKIARPEVGTTVTPTLGSAGTAANVIPAFAKFHVDVRAETEEELERVDAALSAHRPTLLGTEINLDRRGRRSPMPESISSALFARASRIAVELGLDRLRGTKVGGGSDGNITAALGIPTLDGLGPVGAGAHAEGEHIVISAMAERAALVAGLIDDMRDDFR